MIGDLICRSHIKTGPLFIGDLCTRRVARTQDLSSLEKVCGACLCQWLYILVDRAPEFKSLERNAIFSMLKHKRKLTRDVFVWAARNIEIGFWLMTPQYQPPGVCM